MKRFIQSRKQKPQHRKSRIIWITGASSGLGRSLALVLADQGHQVIASARNEEALRALQTLSPRIVALPCDIVDETSLETLRLSITEKFGAIDQAILNAGTCEYLDFPDPDWSIMRRVMEVNYFGAINSLRVALPLLRDSDCARPHIVAIASQVTNAPFAKAEAYGASKAALQYFFNSLRIDLAPENIDVTLVNPGFVDTPLTRKNEFAMPFLMDSETAAKRIVRHIACRPRSYSFPKRLQALLFMSKLAPGFWQKMVAADNDKTARISPTGQDKA